MGQVICEGKRRLLTMYDQRKAMFANYSKMMALILVLLLFGCGPAVTGNAGFSYRSASLTN
jgi:hypothetical protein